MSTQNAIASYVKLLAEEQIGVKFDSSATTASFNTMTRYVTMPIFDFLTEETNMLLSSHEVGHAKYTPRDQAFMDAFKKFGAVLNIVEDIRIEKLIKREYPGLREIFRSGYITFLKEKFFGLNRPIAEYNFIDRLNLYAKIGHCVDVKFSDEEQSIVYDAMNVETPEDVLAVCERINQFVHDQQEEQSSGAGNKSDESGDAQQEQSSGGSSDETSDETSDTSFDCSDDNSNDGFEDNTDSTSNETSENSQEIVSETIQSFEKNVQEQLQEHQENSNRMRDNRGLINAKAQQHVVNINMDELPDADTTLLKIADISLDIQRRNKNCRKTAHVVKYFSDMCRRSAGAGNQYFQQLKSAKNLASVRYKQSGRIDTRRLAKYMTTDNIFKTRSITSEQTNHGLVILVDMSGSMQYQFCPLMMQVATTAEFCRVNDIAFEIIGFGACPNPNSLDNVYFGKYSQQLHTDTYSNIQLLGNSSNFSIERLITIAVGATTNLSGGLNPYVIGLGFTPTVRGMATAAKRVAAMKAVGIENVNMMLITDGDCSAVLQNQTDERIVKYNGKNVASINDNLNSVEDIYLHDDTTYIIEGNSVPPCIKTYTANTFKNITRPIYGCDNAVEGMPYLFYDYIKNNLDCDIMLVRIDKPELNARKGYTFDAAGWYRVSETEHILNGTNGAVRAEQLNMKDFRKEDIAVTPVVGHPISNIYIVNGINISMLVHAYMHRENVAMRTNTRRMRQVSYTHTGVRTDLDDMEFVTVLNKTNNQLKRFIKDYAKKIA